MQNKEQLSEQKAEKNLQEVEASLNKTEQFIENNYKTLAFGALAIIAIVAVVMLFNNLYSKPQQQEAQANIFNAQYYFEADSFRLALDGDGVNMGLLAVADEYSSTPAGKLAKYTAGVAYMKLGEFENAIKMFESYNGDDEVYATLAVGLIGDAQMELGNADKAIAQYKKAAGKGNKIASPIYLKKLGDAQRIAGNKAEALKAYESLKADYPRFPMVANREIEKFIEMVK